MLIFDTLLVDTNTGCHDNVYEAQSQARGLERGYLSWKTMSLFYQRF